ncbi:MAG: hypothetical protein BGO97_12645 [Micrococcales bacterium 70-64]|nr:hypothetical protein [Leifsonia sp.]ODU64798.1 MAG: hypothetical protein ABT06_12645 [Leifsonia sp. SCN 70-46]OJX86489.1 MAG: hypothetical protein BGO97_12645 [Micrococcales bacterium 70-64]
MLLLKRMRQRALVFAALLVVSAITSGVALGTLGFLASSEADGVRSQLAQRTGGDRALELSLTSEPDAVAQDARMRDFLSRTFSTDGRMLDFAVIRSVEAINPVATSLGVKAYVASLPDLPTHADLVAGTWPSGADEAAVQADAADGLGLAPGDVVTVGGATLTVAATWRAADPDDPRWLDSPRLLDGIDAGVRGPVVVDESALAAIGAQTRTNWTIVPVVESLQAGDLAVIVGVWRNIADALRADGGFDVNGLDLNGRFASSATSTQATVDALAAVAPVTLLVVAAIAILTLVQLARLLASLRGSEWLLLWSRGDTAPRLTLTATVEAVAVSAVGAAAGAVAAALLLGRDPALLGPAVWAAPAAVALAAALAFGATTLLAVRSIAGREAPEEGGRVLRVTGVAGPVLLTLAAALSTWQLLLYGSPLTPGRSGALEVDPVAVVSPALALLALVTLAVSAAPLLARGLDSRARRSRGLALVPRTLSRRMRALAAPLVLCALACGQLTLAAGYAQTWDTAYTSTSALRAGSVLTVAQGRTDLTDYVLSAIAATDGVSRLASVYAEHVVVGETPAALVAATPTALTALATTAGGVFDPASAAETVTAQLEGPVIPAGLREVVVTTTTNSDVPVGLTLVLADELGVQHEVRLDDGRGTLPEGDGGWRILALVVDLPPDGPGSFRLDTLTVDGVDVALGDGWSQTGFDPTLAEVTPSPTGAGFRNADGLLRVRLAPLLGDATDEVRPPVLVSSALAETAGIRVGDVVPIALDARLPAFACVVAGIIPAVPGADTESAVLLDARVVESLRAKLYYDTPSPSTAWVGSDDPTAALAQLRSALPSGVTARSLTVDADRGILSSAATALWIGATGAGILAMVALVAVAGSQARSRRGEVLVLRALGVSDRELSASRRLELGSVLVVGVVVGLLAGVVVTVLTIPALARAAVPGAYGALATTVGVQPLGLGIGLAALCCAMGILLAVYGRRAAR